MSFDLDNKYFDEPNSPRKLDFLFANYNKLSKWKFLDWKIANSYLLQYYHISKLLRDQAEHAKILEVGPGGSITGNVLKSLGFNYFSLDGQIDNKPDICCDVREFNGNKYRDEFSLIAAFQILEHIGYNEALSVMSQFKLATTDYVFISLPFCNTSFKIELKIQSKSKFLNNLSKTIFRRFESKTKKNRKYRSEFIERYPFAVHYWEIGREGLTLKKFIGDVERSTGLKLVTTFPNEVFQYHQFFIFKKG